MFKKPLGKSRGANGRSTSTSNRNSCTTDNAMTRSALLLSLLVPTFALVGCTDPDPGNGGIEVDNSNDNNNANGDDTGTVVVTPTCTLTANPTSLDFGDILVGYTVERAFSVSYEGDSACSDLSLTVVSSGDSVFTTDNSGVSLSIGSSKSFIVSFNPAAVDSFAGMVSFTGAISLDVTLFGNGVECSDVDNDGVCDEDDQCEGDDSADSDGDGVCDGNDREECDGLDNDGDGQTDEGLSDVDSDGVCDDIDSESCDGIDNTGEGNIDEGMPDSDGDGLCDGLDSEVCDGLDNDGDGVVDNGFDNDADGYTWCSVPADCNDTDANIYPGAPETWYDGVDQDCSYTSDYDQDGDGFTAEEYGGDDCEDTDATVYPCAAEISGDGVTNDCNAWGGDTGEEPTPTAELCNGADDDLDGVVDDGNWSLSGTSSCFGGEWCDYDDIVPLCDRVGATFGYVGRDTTASECSDFAADLAAEVSGGTLDLVTDDGRSSNSATFEPGVLYTDGNGYQSCYIVVHATVWGS
jgi:hypothetical protein